MGSSFRFPLPYSYVLPFAVLETQADGESAQRAANEVAATDKNRPTSRTRRSLHVRHALYSLAAYLLTRWGSTAERRLERRRRPPLARPRRVRRRDSGPSQWDEEAEKLDGPGWGCEAVESRVFGRGDEVAGLVSVSRKLSELLDSLRTSLAQPVSFFRISASPKFELQQPAAHGG